MEKIIKRERTKIDGKQMPDIGLEKEDIYNYICSAMNDSNDTYKKFIDRCWPLAQFIMPFYEELYHDRRDLVNDCYIGIMNAIEQYGENEKYEFREFVLMCIDEEICSKISKDSSCKGLSHPLKSVDECNNPEERICEAIVIDDVIGELPHLQSVIATKFIKEGLSPEGVAYSTGIPVERVNLILDSSIQAIKTMSMNPSHIEQTGKAMTKKIN